MCPVCVRNSYRPVSGTAIEYNCPLVHSCIRNECKRSVAEWKNHRVCAGDRWCLCKTSNLYKKRKITVYVWWIEPWLSDEWNLDCQIIFFNLSLKGNSIWSVSGNYMNFERTMGETGLPFYPLPPSRKKLQLIFITASHPITLLFHIFKRKNLYSDFIKKQRIFIPRGLVVELILIFIVNLERDFVSCQ